ncbi:YolD-like family protein [Halalkalibacter kiskunsagensis]|uniref:YolD-like family protein n=1 Tax=Halalkalibacter kiskunsagensis TaxID=1548599 RepID=A0ABV6KEY7_9BACI
MLHNKISKGSNMRWEGSRIMLPEHVEALRKLKEEHKKVPKPELEEQELQEIGIVVMDSLNYELQISLSYWNDGFYKDVVGVIDRVDMQSKRIKIRLNDDDFEFVDIDCLKSVERL